MFRGRLRRAESQYRHEGHPSARIAHPTASSVESPSSQDSVVGYSPPMTLVWEQVVVATRDPVALGRWWSSALRWVIVNDDPTEFEIRSTPDRLPGILFLPIDETKQAKNRLHIDLRPDDQSAEVARLIELGASRVDVGQGDVAWVVLADPEGNEFCVLGPEASTDVTGP